MIATSTALRQTASNRAQSPLFETLFSQRWESVTDQAPWEIDAGSRSECGMYRVRNEDCCVADVDGGVFLVADGVGGHSGGKEASQVLAHVLPHWLRQTARCAWRDVDLIEAAVSDAVEAAREEMSRLAEVHYDLGRMAATMALALIVDRTLYISRVGDCRAYLLRDGRLRRLTADQTFVQAAIDVGLLTEEAARDHMWRHVVTNAVGVKPLDEPITVEEFSLAAGDRLLLCSDGLTDAIRDTELQQVLAFQRSPQWVADALVEMALAHDSRDNVTCIVVDVEEVL